MYSYFKYWPNRNFFVFENSNLDKSFARIQVIHSPYLLPVEVCHGFSPIIDEF
jgi:hypothetical protein